MLRRTIRKIGWVSLLILPIALAAYCVTAYPFSDVIARKTLSTSGLTATQKSNIQLAARALNGTVIKPGEEFSFNGKVGPRTTGRGYRPAPSYLGPESPATVGGGVCLVSSAMYQIALETGCKIEQRVPHLRTIRTVPPGFDATVWYGQADLRFRNSLPCPVQVSSRWENNTLSIFLMGKRPANYVPATVTVAVDRRTTREMVVQLFRRNGDKEMLVSRDLYVTGQ